MSSENEQHKATGNNIIRAFQVVTKTYENLDKFFQQMDAVSADQNFVPITPKYLRWKSDIYPSGWFIRSFIKLYQNSNDTVDDLQNSGLRRGPVFGVEVSFMEEDVPKLILSRFTYNPEFFPWESRPSVTEHWGFHYPIHDVNRFDITAVGEYLKSIPKNTKVTTDFWNLERAYFKKVDFVPVNSTTQISEVIFGEFIKLRDLE